MNLPFEVHKKVCLLYLDMKQSSLKQMREILTDKYKNNSGRSVDLVENSDEGILYSISRMPATFSVVCTLLQELVYEGLLEDVSTVIDVGSGTGSGYFAVRETFEDAKIDLYEKNKNMIHVFNKITDEPVAVNEADIIKQNIDGSADLVMASYVLSEMTQTDRETVLKKLCDAAKKYILIVDSGTPQNFAELLRLARLASGSGFHLVAPCFNEVCPLSGDYCQFYSRVERSSLHRISKSGKLPYEDEKYFYILLSKQPRTFSGERVIRRPKILPDEIDLCLCSNSGVTVRKVTRKDGQDFKRAKKVKINQIFK